jgi:hypothetical protein
MYDRFLPVELLIGGSVGALNTQPQCLSSRLFERERCQVGWVTDRPMTSSRPWPGSSSSSTLTHMHDGVWIDPALL